MSELETGFRLTEVVDLIRRRVLLIVVLAVIGAVLGFLSFSGAPTKYSATSKVEVGNDPLAPTSGAGASTGPNMETEKDLVKSDAVANYVRAKLKLDTNNRDIRQRITVTITDKSLVMVITFEAGNAAEAQDGANAVAQAYLANRKASVVAEQKAGLITSSQQIADGNKAATAARAEIAASKPGTAEYQQAQTDLNTANQRINTATTNQAKFQTIDVNSVGDLSQAASAAAAVTSKKALAKGVGIFGVFVLIGLVAAWLLDRRAGLGGGRRKVEKLLPNANIRAMPGSDGRSASAAEVDTAIDRLAVELVAGASPGRAKSVLIIGAGIEPPIAIAEEIASSLAFAGIPALFVLAGSTDRALRGAQMIGSFADLLTGPSVAGPASLPETAGGVATQGPPTVTWLCPRGSAEASGLLRRAVVESLVTRAARERFEAVVFVAPAPSRTAAGTALGQWVERTALVVTPDDRSAAEAAATALTEADVRVTEVVWT